MPLKLSLPAIADGIRFHVLAPLKLSLPAIADGIRFHALAPLKLSLPAINQSRQAEPLCSGILCAVT